MDVRCPQCQTLYELDEQQVSSRMVSLKCSQCRHVFRLASGRFGVVQENTRRWMVRRKKTGDILYLTTFDTLHEWIMKRECRKEDQISRTEKKWVALGDISEFGPLFSVVESISKFDPTASSIATRVPTGTHGVGGGDGNSPLPMPQDPNAPARERVRTQMQYPQSRQSTPEVGKQRTEDITKKVGPTGPALPPTRAPTPSPTPTRKPPPPAPRTPPGVPANDLEPSGLHEDSWSLDLGESPLETHTSQMGIEKSNSGIWILLLLLAVVGVGGFLVVTQPDLLNFEERAPEPVVTIGAEPAPAPVESDGPQRLQDATQAALAAAQSENDAIWTMWHSLAADPFYVALDTAYAAADEAAAHDSVDDKLRDARNALENGRLDDASRKFQAVLVRNPGNSKAITGLGWAYLEKGQAREAAGEFRRAMDVNSEEGDAYIGLGTALRQLGDTRAAYDAYDLYLGRFPRGAKASIAAYQMEQLRKQLGL